MTYYYRVLLIISLSIYLSACSVGRPSFATRDFRGTAISIRQLTAEAVLYDNKFILVYGCIKDVDGPDPFLVFDFDYTSSLSRADKILYLARIPSSKRLGLKTQKSTPANKLVYPRVVVSGIFHFTPIIPHSPAWAFKGVDAGDIGYLSAPSIAHVYPDQCAQAL